MKKIKLIVTLLVAAAILSSCKSGDNSSDQKNNSVKETESVSQLPEGEEAIDVKCNIFSSEEEVNKKVLDGLFFKTSNEWKNAVKECDLELVNKIKDNYDEDFFKSHSLCYYSTSGNGNMKYKLKTASLKKNGGKNILTVYTSCDSSEIVDSLWSYDFFIETDKSTDSIDEVIIKD